MLGLVTPVASFMIAGTMVVAIGLGHLAVGDPYIADPPSANSYESALGYLALSAMLMLSGPGRLSLDAIVFRNRRDEGSAGEVETAFRPGRVGRFSQADTTTGPQSGLRSSSRREQTTEDRMVSV